MSCSERVNASDCIVIRVCVKVGVASYEGAVLWRHVQVGFRELVLFPPCSAVGLVCVCGWDGRSQQETASVLASCPEKDKLGVASYEDAVVWRHVRVGFRGLVLFPFCSAAGLACVCE